MILENVAGPSKACAEMISASEEVDTTVTMGTLPTCIGWKRNNQCLWKANKHIGANFQGKRRLMRLRCI